MSAVSQELRHRQVIDLIEQGLSNVKINKRTGVDRAVIARIRASRPPAVAFTPEPSYAVENFLHDLGVRPPERADADAAPVTEKGTALNTPRTDATFVKQLTQRVATIVRHGPEGPRIAKIKNVGNPFMVVVADTVDRLLVFRAGQKIDYTKQLPKALAAADDGDNKPLASLVTRAAKASRMALFARTKSVGRTVDVTDIDKVTAWVHPEQQADTEAPADETERAPAELAVHDATANVPQHLADADVPSTGDLVERIEKDEDGNSTGSEMTGNFALSNKGSLVEANDTGAAYTVGEEAQLDARERMDRGDSANYKGTPKRVQGFASDAAKWDKDTGPRPSASTMARGGQRPTWAEMKAEPRAAMTDLDHDMVEMTEMERLARRVLRLQLAAEEAPNQNQNQYGIGTPRPHDAIVVPEPESKPRGSGRVRRGASQERVANLKAELDARMARLQDKMAQDALRAAREYAQTTSKARREADEWARAVKAVAPYGIGEETLLQLMQKTRTPVSGLGGLLLGLLKK